jgi:hypothetical protein
MQLAGASIWGVALYMLSLVALFSYLEMSRSTASARGRVEWLVRICAGLAIVAPGVILKFRAVSLLRAGIRQERWHEKELDALRRQVDRPVWTVALWLMAGLVLVCGLLLSRHPAVSSVWLFVWMPWSLILELRSTLRKAEALPSKMLDWSSAKPLESEHGGPALKR